MRATLCTLTRENLEVGLGTEFLPGRLTNVELHPVALQALAELGTEQCVVHQQRVVYGRHRHPLYGQQKQ